MIDILFNTEFRQSDGIDVTEVTATFPDGSHIFRAFWGDDEQTIDRWKLLLINDCTPM